MATTRSKKLRVKRETLKKLTGKVRTGVRAGRSLMCPPTNPSENNEC